jgi:hypothetical protein
MASVDGLFDMDGCEPNDRLLLNVNEVGLTLDFLVCVNAGAVLLLLLPMLLFGTAVVRNPLCDTVGDACEGMAF